MNMSNQLLQLNKFDLSSIELTLEAKSIVKRGSALSWNISEIINKFDLNLLTNKKVAIIGKEIGSESQLMHNIVSHLSKNLPCGVVISPKNKLTKFYDDIIPTIFILEKYTKETINNILFRQQIKIQQKTTDPRAYLIMDDCVDSVPFIKNEEIKTIFFEGKCYCLSFVLSMQYPISIPCELRQQFDYIFLLGEETYTYKKKIYEYYAGIFESFEKFNQIFSQITENNKCMIIDNCTRSTDLNKKIFWL